MARIFHADADVVVFRKLKRSRYVGVLVNLHVVGGESSD
jgi:hypothetical protein